MLHLPLLERAAPVGQVRGAYVALLRGPRSRVLRHTTSPGLAVLLAGATRYRMTSSYFAGRPIELASAALRQRPPYLTVELNKPIYTKHIEERRDCPWRDVETLFVVQMVDDLCACCSLL
jgi:hypothetical protein